MEMSNKTARQLFEHVQANPTRKRFGFGKLPALINIDLQKAYTCVGEFATAYDDNAFKGALVNESAKLTCTQTSERPHEANEGNQEMPTRER
jgi:hypothetical protein